MFAYINEVLYIFEYSLEDMEKENNGGYLRKVEECFDDVIISIQEQIGNTKCHNMNKN